MKYLAILLLTASILGCSTTPKQKRMQAGKRANVDVVEYTEMCEREPESVLCRVEEKK